jgi:hypothetical protein
VSSFRGTEAEARELAKLLNDERRHLTREDRAAWLRKVRERGLSTRAIADAVKVDQATVRKDIREGERNRSPQPGPAATERQEPTPEPASKPAPAKVTDLDGKRYPAKRPEVKPVSKPGTSG